MDPGDRRLVAIMFTDMVGFTMAARRNEAAALELLREQEVVVRQVVEVHGGREIKSTGDGALIEFPSVLRAGECAIALQHRLHDRNATQVERPIHLRIGIHVGDVESRGGDIFGSAVNIAARILSVAEPDGIALSEQTAHSLENRISLPIQSIGSRGLKGIDRPVNVFRVALPWSGPVEFSIESAYPRVAVLPLRNISPDPGDEYFADGLTDELVSVLGRLDGLRVIARSSVVAFQREAHPIAEISKRLGVTAVLEGSVRKAGDSLRVSLQLVDAASQEGLWSETFHRNLSDIFQVQAEIARRTASSLKIHLRKGEGGAVVKASTNNLEAYGLYLQGVHRLRTGNQDDAAEASDFFRRAIEADPDFAAAHAHLAHRLIGSIGESRPAREVLPEARRLVERALVLDPNSSEAHAAKANLAMQGDQAWGVAEAEFRRALELNPSDDTARTWFGLLLRSLQRFPEALEQFRAAVQLNPLASGAHGLIGSVYRIEGALDRAEEYLRGPFAGSLSPAAVHVALAYTYAYAGRDEDAKRELELGARRVDIYAELDAVVLKAALGDPGPARQLLEHLEAEAARRYVPLFSLALLAAATGDPEKAIAYFERDWTEGDRGLWYVYQGLACDSIRSDPRFIDMLRRMGLPTSTTFRRGKRDDGSEGRPGAR